MPRLKLRMVIRKMQTKHMLSANYDQGFSFALSCTLFLPGFWGWHYDSCFADMETKAQRNEAVQKWAWAQLSLFHDLISASPQQIALCPTGIPKHRVCPGQTWEDDRAGDGIPLGAKVKGLHSPKGQEMVLPRENMTWLFWLCFRCDPREVAGKVCLTLRIRVDTLPQVLPGS